MSANVDDASSDASSVAGSLPGAPRAKQLLRAVREDDDATSVASDVRALGAFESQFVFKVADMHGKMHRVQASDASFADLKAAVAKRVNCAPDALCLEYADDDGDAIVLVDDHGLNDAVTFARASGQAALKLTASLATEPPSRLPPPAALAGAAAAAAAGLLVLLLKKR